MEERIAAFPARLGLSGVQTIIFLKSEHGATTRRNGIPYDSAFFAGFALPELLRATAWRTSALKADSSTATPSWMSIARRVFPSRLELKRRVGSWRYCLGMLEPLTEGAPDLGSRAAPRRERAPRG